jgi:methionyl-tRNA synthetase
VVRNHHHRQPDSKICAICAICGSALSIHQEAIMNHHERQSTRPARYITTAIPYVNAQPHIGHALELILADVLARYHRLRGDDVRFQTGADENSLKNVQAAQQEGIPTAQLVARNAARFAALRPVLDLSFDDFIRTSAEPRHAEGVERFWQACAARGDLYKRHYAGLYCVGCEQFYAEDELVDGRCPTHHTVPERVEEENYFFRLSRYADELYRLIESDQFRIVPTTYKSEILSFIRRGLVDFSVSRSQARAHGWGISVPGDEGQVVYVWFDALINYITALDYAQDGAAYVRFWAGSQERTHIVGKDIIRFHAIYWPAMLLSAGLPLPTQLFVHGFLTVEGQKISKSLGNAIDPVELAQRVGVDALRYYLLRKTPTTSDTDIAWADLVRTYNADLADQLGNLLSRVVKMILQFAEGVVPAPGPLLGVDQQLGTLAAEVTQGIDDALGDFAPAKALALLWTLISAANKYVVAVEPWRLAQRVQNDPTDAEARQRLATTLFVLAETLRVTAHLLAPFLPGTAAAITQQLGVTLAGSGDWRSAQEWGAATAGARVQPGPPLFPKLRA